MAWNYGGSIQSGWQNDMAVQARIYWDNLNLTARTISWLAECYLVTTNGRYINASFSGAALVGSWGGGLTTQFVGNANSTTYFTGYATTLSYNANGELDFWWGARLNTNNVITFSQEISGLGTAQAIAPLPLTSLSVSRVSDTQHTVSWSIPSGVTNTEVIIQRRTDDGNWAQVGRPSGNPSSWVDTTTVANRKYEYRVAGVRNGRQAAWTGTVVVYTTPAAIGSLSAAKEGSSIQVDASGLPPYATAYDVYDNGSLVASNVTSFPWVHVSPNSGVTHTYTVKSKRGALVSGFSSPSNTVQLLAAPNAPTGLSPNGGAAASDQPCRFGWQHNPVDTTAQTAYELRYRVGAGAWTTLSGTTVSYRDVTLAEGTYEWQVRTRGAHADWSPWSASATVTVITRPGVAVTQPGGSWDQPVLPVTWSWVQAQGGPQSAWRVELLDAASQVLEVREGSGAATSVTLTTRLVDGAEHTVRVQAATGDVWSGWASQAFEVAFVPPDAPVVSGGWDEQSGSVSLTVEAGVDGPSSPAAVSVLVERSVDAGATWEVVLSAEPGNSLSDWESLSRGVTEYRVTAFASSGAATSVVYPVEATSVAVWLSGGIGFSRTARLPYDPVVKISAGRARSVQRYEGRSHGVPYAGEQLSRVVEVSGRLRAGDPDVVSADALALVAQDVAPLHMYRDPDGRRVYGVLSSVTMPRQSNIGLWGYGFTLEESDR